MDTKEHQQEFIFRSKLPDIYIPNHLPLHTYIFENISQFSSRPCLINSTTGDIFSYADVQLTTRKVASGLIKIGIQQGDVIMLLLQNSPEFIFSFLGVSYCGAISTTANPFYTPSEIAKQAKGSKAKLIITHACYVEKVKDFAEENDVKIVCTDGSSEGCIDFSELTQANENDLPAVTIEPNHIVALPYSSGTTGLPKGVMLTHKNLVTSVAVLVDGENPNMNFHSQDVIMCVLPLFHIYCLNSVFLCALRVGATLVIMKKFEINSCMELVQKYKVTITPFVPPILLAMAKSPLIHNYDLSSIRMVQSGGAPLGKELEDAIKAKLPNAILGQGCGMTEGGPVAMCPAFAKEPSEAKSGSCGKVVRNIEMKIVDVESGASLPRNQPGEICIRGDQVMKGYLNDPENTSKTIDKEGWLHSGDIAYMDDDDEIFIVDRLKEIIKYKGFQVAPAELEAMLVAHPCISEAVVVPMKDEAAGEVPVAFVVRENGMQISEEEIKSYIAEQVIFYKRIKRVFFTESIPKAPSGKLLRKEVRTKLLAGLA